MVGPFRKKDVESLKRPVEVVRDTVDLPLFVHGPDAGPSGLGRPVNGSIAIDRLLAMGYDSGIDGPESADL